MSSGYLVRARGAPRLLVDAGWGVFERLERVGVNPADLDAVLLTHTHIDHSGGLAPIVFAAFMQGRTRPLRVVGPSAKGDQPGCKRFCDLLFGPSGAWNYLHTFDGFGIDTLEVAHDAAHPGKVDLGVERPEKERSHDELRVSAVGVAHGMMPSLAYRIDCAGHSVVVSGDLEGCSDALVELAEGCDVLVHDQSLPRRDSPHGHLHPPPLETAHNAAAAGAKVLVLSHLMPLAAEARGEIVDEIASGYSGLIHVASDLLTVDAA